MDVVHLTGLVLPGPLPAPFLTDFATSFITSVAACVDTSRTLSAVLWYIFRCIGSSALIPPNKFISVVKSMLQFRPMTVKSIGSLFRRVIPEGAECCALAISLRELLRAADCRLAPAPLSVNFSPLPKQVEHNKAATILYTDET